MVSSEFIYVSIALQSNERQVCSRLRLRALLARLCSSSSPAIQCWQFLERKQARARNHQSRTAAFKTVVTFAITNRPYAARSIDCNIFFHQHFSVTVYGFHMHDITMSPLFVLDYLSWYTYDRQIWLSSAIIASGGDTSWHDIPHLPHFQEFLPLLSLSILVYAVLSLLHCSFNLFKTANITIALYLVTYSRAL